MVVATFFDHACTGGNLKLIAADTGLLIMLIDFCNSLMGEITIKSKSTKKQRAILRDTGNIAERIGDVR